MQYSIQKATICNQTHRDHLLSHATSCTCPSSVDLLQVQGYEDAAGTGCIEASFLRQMLNKTMPASLADAKGTCYMLALQKLRDLLHAFFADAKEKGACLPRSTLL